MYQIVLTENRKKIKVLYNYSRGYDATYRFDRIKSENVSFPKKFVYKDKKLTSVVYEVLLLKKREENDKDRVIRNKYGKFVDESVDDKDWVIVDKIDYLIEEQFNVTGANRKLTAKEIIDHVLKMNLKDNNPKQVVMVNNKVVVEGLSLHMVTCKNNDEAIRLYNYMRSYCFDNNIGNIIFFGTVEKSGRKVWYKKIHEVTGVSYNRLYRKSSR
jgi:hypothetical protein